MPGGHTLPFCHTFVFVKITTFEFLKLISMKLQVSVISSMENLFMDLAFSFKLSFKTSLHFKKGYWLILWSPYLLFARVFSGQEHPRMQSCCLGLSECTSICRDVTKKKINKYTY